MMAMLETPSRATHLVACRAVMAAPAKMARPRAPRLDVTSRALSRPPLWRPCKCRCCGSGRASICRSECVALCTRSCAHVQRSARKMWSWITLRSAWMERKTAARRQNRACSCRGQKMLEGGRGRAAWAVAASLPVAEARRESRKNLRLRVFARRMPRVRSSECVR